jgi:serine/threonine protein kinase
MQAEKFDAHHRDVQMGEVTAGLHRVEGHVRPGVPLLEGSRVKEAEAESFRQWQEKLRRQAPQASDAIQDFKDLDFDPISEAEWLARGKEVPKTKKAQRMSKLGGGAFGETYRKRARRADAGAGVTCFAVKVFLVDKMEDLQIREEDVRREASTLGMLRHKNVIKYFGLVKTEDEMSLVMELASGGSMANLIAKRANGLGVETGEVFEMLAQTADALDYIHSQGIIHRDIKPDNILFAHDEDTGPMYIKLADFGVAAVLNTVAGSALMSKVGTPVYLSPERGHDEVYGALADIWSLGVVLAELVTLLRQTRGLWHQGPEVSERRANLLQQVARKDEVLGKIATELLHVDKNSRLSACALKTTLRNALRSRVCVCVCACACVCV